MDAQIDGSGNSYIDVRNIRITIVPQTWKGPPGIRIQAYKENGQLFPGAELPVPDKTTAFDLLSAVSYALQAVVIDDGSRVSV